MAKIRGFKPDLWTDDVVYDGPMPKLTMAEFPVLGGSQREAFVYLLLDANGLLLYVGRARVPANRLGHHRRHKTWWVEVSRLVLARVEGQSRRDTDARVAHLEMQLIRDLGPTYNIVGKAA